MIAIAVIAHITAAVGFWFLLVLVTPTFSESKLMTYGGYVFLGSAGAMHVLMAVAAFGQRPRPILVAASAGVALGLTGVCFGFYQVLRRGLKPRVRP